MTILVLFRPAGAIAAQEKRIDESADTYGLYMVPVILDGDVCVKLVCGGQWISIAQYGKRGQPAAGP